MLRGLIDSHPLQESKIDVGRLAFMINMRGLFYKIFHPKSEDEDIARREYVLNILLVSCALLFLATFLISSYQYFALQKYRGTSPLFFLFTVFIFGGLYALSKRGKSKVASFLFLGLFFILPVYAVFDWGADVVAGLLFFVLAIIMSGILLGSRIAFWATGLSSLSLITVGYLQTNQIIHPDSYWKAEPFKVVDTILVAIIFLIIATVSWLSNKEMQKSLKRARQSEADLKQERDLLEVKVEQRTKELKEVQAEKMTQLYRFAEFGRISSGLFHDLINPLNAVSLNLGKVSGVENHPSISDTKEYVDNAVHAAKRLEDLVIAVRKQLRREETNALFLLDEEIRHVIEVLSHKAQKANVQLNFLPIAENMNFQIVGDAVKFNQIVLNLLANGIDACSDTPDESGEKWVRISLMGAPQTIVMVVEDNGSGIPDQHMDKIFEPFFTTKTNGQGLGDRKSVV